MKKILFVLAVFFGFGVSVACADNNKVISKNELPAPAQKLLNEYFPDAKLSYAKLDRDFLERSYEVLLVDGTKLEFFSNGEWQEVDCKFGEVPAGIGPEAIIKYIADNYPGEKVLKIEFDRGNYEVKLSNRLELTFNKNFRIVDIDD